MTEEQKSLQWLSGILDILRKECPWDRAQTVDTLRYLTVEEVYELSEAVLAGDYEEMRKELGDIFMHILFYSKIASDEGRFTLADVIDGISEKLLSRHPHIALPDREGVMIPACEGAAPQWEKVKMREGRKSVLEGVPRSLPPMVKAVRMQEKAAGMGFEFADAKGAHAKVEEEYGELLEAIARLHEESTEEAREHAVEETGDLLFAIVKWVRMEGVNADEALSRANQKFYNRFTYMERAAAERGRTLSELTLDEMEVLWNEAKSNGGRNS